MPVKSMDTMNESSRDELDEQLFTQDIKRKKREKDEDENLKRELLKKAFVALSSGGKETSTVGDRFASYVAERLTKLSSCKQVIAEKKITDVLFEVEMLDDDNVGASNSQLQFLNIGVATSTNDSSYTRGGFHMNFLIVISFMNINLKHL